MVVQGCASRHQSRLDRPSRLGKIRYCAVHGCEVADHRCARNWASPVRAGGGAGASEAACTAHLPQLGDACFKSQLLLPAVHPLTTPVLRSIRARLVYTQACQRRPARRCGGHPDKAPAPSWPRRATQRTMRWCCRRRCLLPSGPRRAALLVPSHGPGAREEASGPRLHDGGGAAGCVEASGAAAGPVAPPWEAQPCECGPTRGWMWGAAGQHEGAHGGVPWRVSTANKVRAAPSASSYPEAGPQAGVGWPVEGIRAPPPTASSAPPPPPSTPTSASQQHPHLRFPQRPS